MPHPWWLWYDWDERRGFSWAVKLISISLGLMCTDLILYQSMLVVWMPATLRCWLFSSVGHLVVWLASCPGPHDPVKCVLCYAVHVLQKCCGWEHLMVPNNRFGRELMERGGRRGEVVGERGMVGGEGVHEREEEVKFWREEEVNFFFAILHCRAPIGKSTPPLWRKVGTPYPCQDSQERGKQATE